MFFTDSSRLDIPARVLPTFQADCPNRTYFTGSTYAGRVGALQVSAFGPLNPSVTIESDSDDSSGSAPRGLKKLATGRSTTFRLENEPHGDGAVSGTFDVVVEFRRRGAG